ncbi:alpha/beta hydrolase [Rhodococcus sp. Leaf7]|uniref:alpha/beta fold hydrolase n=1 Tax=unclassified Rhodococcus (in: high G+C Gram-positive bacteria) TaxID=192944 RepID=UPI0006FFDFC4|nr:MULTISPECIES: alpha/beta hydrolase [unclassified Rhodococcus (in: high G+C Gram-positive bacteria)]KQU07153.1 alpha/beta hydrolase [Rhodococcus sp. Leaf7]KQU42671.1 alpha/beta hydrolase [Rhodococcus sp. Leaf247]
MKFFVTRDEHLRLDAAARATLRGDFARLPDGHTHYELTGPPAGDLIVCVPGLTIPLFYWDHVLPHLHASGLRTLTFSAYGRGYSDRVEGRYDEAMFVRQLRDLLIHLQIDEPVHLVSTSMGALIAMAFSLHRPDAVRTLTLLGPAGLSTDTAFQQKILQLDPAARTVAQLLGRWLLLGHLEHNVADKMLVEPLTRMIADCYHYEGSMYSFFSTLQNYPLSGRHDLFRLTGDLGIPTLLAWGTLDTVTPIAGLDTARDLLRPIAVEALDMCGHMAPYERPETTADIISAFLTIDHERTTR